MERLELESFLILAEELHFGRTAERLMVTRARVSQTIAKLERQVGAPLFERTSRRVRLTPLGKHLHDDLAPAYACIRDGLARAKSAAMGMEGELHVGFVGAATGELLMGVLDLFARRHPATAVHIHETQLGDFVEPLRESRVDVLMAQLPVVEPDLVTGPVVLTVPAVLAVSSRHQLARREAVRVEDLARAKVFACGGSLPEYWVTANNNPRTTPAGWPIERGDTAATIQETLALVAAGRGVASVGEDVSRFHPRPGVTYVPFEDAHPITYAPVWRASGETERVRAFVRACAETQAIGNSC
ncbi:LysR family transcriptional regulator [Nonomuraea antimicrobica]|uniref:LysR family transcriptional regulator n=1 Tax=Nonomuraea antimicrobica TaxID=561173 RepID=A0ABP7CK48_9ACTN